jgi:hypothetical protein
MKSGKSDREAVYHLNDEYDAIISEREGTSEKAGIESQNSSSGAMPCFHVRHNCDGIIVNKIMPLLYNIVVSVAILCLLSLHFTNVAHRLIKSTVNNEHRTTYEDTKTNVSIQTMESTKSFADTSTNNRSSSSATSHVNTPSEDIAVFYNLFVDPEANETEVDRVKDLVNEQLSLKQPWHQIFVNSIGLKVDTILDDIPDATLLQHTPEGSEMISLRSIYDYCHHNPTRKVVYLHSKGSYHPRPENEPLRQFLTRGALSPEASQANPAQCNLVSSRFSPTPHPHTSGNMWLAHCSYVQNLIPPDEFTERMAQVENLTQSHNFACIGSHRFAAEHWIHSHPSVKPCDLYTDTSFQWGYQGLTNTSGTKEGDFQLQPAPRSTWNATVKGCMNLFGKHLMHRLAEYKFLYGILPDTSWWGWKLWHKEFEALFNSTIPSINDTSIQLVPMEHPKW